MQEEIIIRDSDVDVVAIVHGDRKTLQQQLKKVWDSSCELELEYDINSFSDRNSV